MLYDESKVFLSYTPETREGMYSVILLRSKMADCTLGGLNYLLYGDILLCLTVKDKFSIKSGECEILTLGFSPEFYNINCNKEDLIEYPEMNLFTERDIEYRGFIKLTGDEYNAIRIHLEKAEAIIDESKNDYLWPQKIRTELKTIFRISAGRSKGDFAPLGQKLLRYIRDHISEKITLDDLTKEFNTNRTTVSQEIKRLTGLSPLKYVTEERLYQSRTELFFTDDPIVKIAEKYGFADANYYIRMFKRRFGMTPQAYRSEIKKESDEEIRSEFRRDEKMTVEEFEKYYRAGLGRAITRLENIEDKEPYRERLFSIIEEKGHLHRTAGRYELDIINLFDNKFAVAKNLAEYLLAEIRIGEKRQFIPFLKELGYEKEVREIMEVRYKKAYEDLIELMKKGGSGEDKYPPESSEYMYTAGAMGMYVKPGRERIKKILLDIAGFYDYMESPYIPIYQNPLYMIMDGTGGDELYSLLDEVKKEHPNGEKIDLRSELVEQPKITATVSESLTLGEMLTNEAYFFPETEILKARFDNAPEKLKLEAAEMILKTDDKRQRDHLLGFFSANYFHEERIAPEFPLDPEPLIKLAEYERKVYDRHGYYNVFYALCNIRHPKVKAYGKKLMSERITEPDVSGYAHRMVYEKNYDVSDRDEFARIIRSYMKTGFAPIEYFIYGLEMGTKGLPTEMIPFIYETIPHERRRFVEALITGGEFSDEIRLESLYDADLKIREMAKENSIAPLHKENMKVYYGIPPKELAAK